MNWTARISLLLAALALGGCVQTQLVDSTRAATYSVVDVRVDASAAANRRPRGFDATEIEVEQLFDRVVTEKLGAANPAAAQSIYVDVDLTSIFLTNPVRSLLLSGNSTAVASVTVRDAATERMLEGPFELNGGDIGLGGAGNAATTAVRGERGLLTSLAEMIAFRTSVAIFGT
ncbi:MAG: hypothetical protein AAGE76_07240 [Pseudomonadota bacterium]